MKQAKRSVVKFVMAPYDVYLATVYKWGIITMVSAAMCAAVDYTVGKLAGLYPWVKWKYLIVFDCMDIVFFVMGVLLVKNSVKNGQLKQGRMQVGKVFSFLVCLIQWNYILYLIPSRSFWGYLSFFLILICFFLDIKLILILGCSCMASLFLAWNIRGEYLLPARDEFFIVDVIGSILAMVLTLIGIVILLYFMKYMQSIQKYNQKLLEVQKKYYKEMLAKDEGMRRFRHDVKKHIGALDVLYQEGEMQKMHDYMQDLVQIVRENDQIHTGNQIADSFLSDAIGKLEENGGKKVYFQVVGNFHSDMKINDSDFCVLFANAVENAKEALEKVQGDRKLILIIKNYQDMTYLILKNSANFVESRGVQSTKKDWRMHGYGMQNMKLVVEKYGGKIEWGYEEEMFQLKIRI